MVRLKYGICFECDDPVAVNCQGWYRCRSCGYESVRSNSAEFFVDGLCSGGTEAERAPASDNDGQLLLGLS